MSQTNVNKNNSNNFSKKVLPQQTKKFTPFLPLNFNIKNFGMSELETNNERSKVHMIAYPRYEGKTVVFQTPEFVISQYGIPPLGDFAKTDAQRTTLKLVLDPLQPACMELDAMFSQIDKWIESNQDTIFPPHLKKMKFSYKSIIREPGVQEDVTLKPVESKKNTSNLPPKPKSNFWKAKLDLEFPSGDVQTVVYKKSATADVLPQRVNVKSVSDLEEYVPWGSKVRMIVMMNKLWAEKNPKDVGISRKFGVAFKILSIETTPREKTGSMRDDIANYAFVNPDDEEENDNDNEKEKDTDVDANTTNDKKPNDLDANQSKQNEKEEDDDEEEDDEEEDDEAEDDEADPEPEPVPVPAPKQTATKSLAKKEPPVTNTPKGKVTKARS